MVSNHRELEDLALAGACLGGKRSPERGHRIQPVNVSAFGCMANVSIYEVVVVAVIMSPGVRVDGSGAVRR